MLKTHGLESPVLGWLNRHALQGIVITDTHLVIQDWNVWMEVHSGISKADIVGKPLLDQYPDIVTRGLNGLYEDALQGQVHILSHRFHQYLFSMPSPSEPSFPKMQQSVQIAPLADETRVVGTITSITDVTERTARERELRNAREAAEFANRSKDRFVAMLSHDLRVPLSSAIGWIRLMKSGKDEAVIKERALKSLEQSTLAQLQMIEDLMDTERISSGKLELNLAAADISKVVNDALALLKPLAEGKSIQLVQTIQQGIPAVTIDEKRIRQVVWNLVSNALKFTPATGTVRLNLSYSNDQLQLIVSDTGAGMDEETAAHIFESMWQSPTAKFKGGLGLGLAIVRRIVDLHGGSIKVESAGPGKGASFIVDLPRNCRIPAQ